MPTKYCFKSNSQLKHNFNQLIPERERAALNYQQLQSSRSPAGGAVAHYVSGIQQLKEHGYLELHGKDPGIIEHSKFITPQQFCCMSLF